MTRLRLIIYGIILLLFIGMGVYIKILHGKVADLDSYKSLYETANKENKVFRHKDSTWRNRTEVATVTKSELQHVKELQELHREFDGIKKSLRNLENFTQTSQITTIHKTVKLKDTTIVSVDSVRIHATTFKYVDKWESISGVIVSDSIQWNISHKDSLKVVQYWDRKWFLGKKKYFTEIKSENPNTIVDYQRSIRAERKRGLF